MKGDFTRVIFNPNRNFSRVLMQQGRAQLDADWNEQAAILLHHLRTTTADLIGPHSGPQGNLGFRIDPADSPEGDFQIRPDDGQAGRYYVDGILCEMHGETPYTGQQDLPGIEPLADKKQSYLVYLDVWERHVTHLQDDYGHLREVALLGADTATRAQVVAQVKTTAELKDQKLPANPPGGAKWPDWVKARWLQWYEAWQPQNRGHLRARCKKDPRTETEPCLASPDDGYRGPENQLYRVEIHTGGEAGEATFKWSRDNGSVVFSVLSLGDGLALVEQGRDDRSSLHINDWVEVLDDELELHGKPGVLAEVTHILPADRSTQVTVTLRPLQDRPLPSYGRDEQAKHPLLRRWDHRPEEESADGAIPIVEAAPGTDRDWILLEHGIRVQFVTAGNGQPAHLYRTGDYWLIPARTATGDVDWPGPALQPEALPPHGVEHHYAPLWVIAVAADGTVTADPGNDLRLVFKPGAR